MLNRANRLSSTPDLFSKEYIDLKAMLLNLKNPEKPIDSSINRFLAQVHDQTESTMAKTPIHIILPFKDQNSADIVLRTYATFSRR